MLVVLSEINCLPYLQSKGINPDVFYTDFHLFKNQIVTLKDLTVVVLFVGNCRFNKRHVVEYCKTLRKYRKNASMGINHVYVISDNIISNLDNYFVFDTDIEQLKIYNGEKFVEDDKVVLDKIRTHNANGKEPIVHLTDFDKGDATALIEEYTNKKTTVADEYKEIIQVPNLKVLLGS